MTMTGFGFGLTETLPSPSVRGQLDLSAENGSELTGEFVAFTDFGPDGSTDTASTQTDNADYVDAFQAGEMTLDELLGLTSGGMHENELTGEFVAF